MRENYVNDLPDEFYEALGRLVAAFGEFEETVFMSLLALADANPFRLIDFVCAQYDKGNIADPSGQIRQAFDALRSG